MPRKPPLKWDIYKDEMYFHRNGDALWEPAPARNYTRINIGDVGFIRRGQFHLLFSAGSSLGQRLPGRDVPSTFEELDIGTLASGQPRRPGCLHTPTVRQVGTGLLDATGFTTLPLEQGMNFSFELTGDRGAALVTRYPTYCEDSLLDSAFEEYTVRHYESWVAFARYKQYGNNVHPVLVSGVDMTRDFAMVAYSNKSTFQEPGQTIAVPMFASAAGSFQGMWHTRCLAHTNHGPQQSSPLPHQLAMYTPFPLQPRDEGSTTSGFVQCVFVRYYTMRSKGPLALFPKVIRASGGPHDLGPGDNLGNTFPELLVQSGAEPAATSYGGLGGQWDPIEDDTELGPDIVVQNTSHDEEYDNWDAIADYVFQNSNATSVLMHHQDLMGIYAVGDSGDISSLLTKKRPNIIVGKSGVGKIICGENRQLEQQGTTPPHSPSSNFQHSSDQDKIMEPQMPSIGGIDQQLGTGGGGGGGGSIDDPILQALWENIESLAPAHDITSPSQINGICIPQKKYEKGAGRAALINQNMVPFVRQDGTYIPVTAAFAGDYSGLVAHDLPALSEAGYTITLRIEWPGYPPYHFLLRSYDWRTPPQKITRAKLATEVARIIKQLVERLATQNVAPEHQQWRVGPNGIQWKDLRLAALEQVSAGSYQPRLFWKPES